MYVDGNRLRDGLYRRETRLVRKDRSAVAKVRIDRTLQGTVNSKVKIAGSTGASERTGGKSYGAGIGSQGLGPGLHNSSSTRNDTFDIDR